MFKEIETFDRHVAEKGLKYSHKRYSIVKTFIDTNRHVSAEELYHLVRRQHPEIGYTTVYRTLRLMVESGLAQVVDFDDGVKRFERRLGREYHAHFICTDCGKGFEVFDDKIRDLCASLAAQQGFAPNKHRYEIFGICQECSSHKAGVA